VDLAMYLRGQFLAHLVRLLLAAGVPEGVIQEFISRMISKAFFEGSADD